MWLGSVRRTAAYLHSQHISPTCKKRQRISEKCTNHSHQLGLNYLEISVSNNVWNDYPSIAFPICQSVSWKSNGWRNLRVVTVTYQARLSASHLGLFGLTTLVVSLRRKIQAFKIRIKNRLDGNYFPLVLSFPKKYEEVPGHVTTTTQRCH